jgi:hypothetical protein
MREQELVFKRRILVNKSQTKTFPPSALVEPTQAEKWGVDAGVCVV